MTKTELRAAGLSFIALTSILALGTCLTLLASPLQSSWAALLL